MQSAPLRLLTPDSIGYFAACAMTTVGGPPDYGHFLPRIVELALDDPPNLGFEPWLIVRKLKYADERAFLGWPGWQASQRAAFRATSLAAWERALCKSSADENVTRWLNALASLGKVTDALDILQRTSSPFAVGHLASFVLEHQKWLVKGERIGGETIQDAAPEVRDEIMAWLCQREVWQRLKDAACAEPDIHWQIEGAQVVLRPADEPY